MMVTVKSITNMEKIQPIPKLKIFTTISVEGNWRVYKHQVLVQSVRASPRPQGGNHHHHNHHPNYVFENISPQC